MFISKEEEKHTGYPETTNATDNNAVEFNRREYVVSTCLGTTCYRSNYSGVVPRQVFTPYDYLLISVAFVVLWVSDVKKGICSAIFYNELLQLSQKVKWHGLECIGMYLHSSIYNSILLSFRRRSIELSQIDFQRHIT